MVRFVKKVIFDRKSEIGVGGMMLEDWGGVR